MPKTYKLAALGGTFDRLHRGHHHLLQTAATVGERLFIGLTQPALYQNKALSSLIQPYDDRERELREWLDQTGLKDRTVIEPLADIYGQTLTNPKIDALVVTEQTVSGAGLVNRERQRLGMLPLPVTVAGMIYDEAGEHISSTRIRQGEINRQGKMYTRLFKADVAFTQAQKELLRQPQGTLYAGVAALDREQLKSAPAIALIGDRVTSGFCKAGLPFTYAVIDYFIENQPFSGHTVNPDLVIANPKSHIAAAAADTIAAAIRQAQPVVFKVEGEEDLLGFPFALLLPLHSLVFYGQPKVGLVMIEITEAAKDRLARMINPQF